MDKTEKLLFSVIGAVIVGVVGLFVLAACTFDGPGGGGDYVPSVPVAVPGVPGALIFI